jgi:LacI family transcriptional regulator
MAATARRVTLRDVAREAGTTTMTVSNVLNGRSDQVGPDTARRVLAATDRLGYRPLAAARQLRAAKRMAIGVVIVDPSPYYLSDPFTSAMLAGLNEALARAGYSLILRGAPAPALGEIPMLRSVECDGMCLVASGPSKERKRILERVASLSVPVVVIQDESGPDDSCAVMLDDAGGADAVARHLARGNPRRVAMLVPGVEWPAMVRREAAVRKVFPNAAVLRCADEGFEATQATLAAHIDAAGLPDALIGGNDRMALAALRLFAARGIPVPTRVRVTGFNGLENHHYAEPPLTTVFSPAFQLGETAADALVHRLAEGSFEFRRRVLPVRFAADRSSQPVPQQGD